MMMIGLDWTSNTLDLDGRSLRLLDALSLSALVLLHVVWPDRAEEEILADALSAPRCEAPSQFAFAFTYHHLITAPPPIMAFAWRLAAIRRQGAGNAAAATLSRRAAQTPSPSSLRRHQHTNTDLPEDRRSAQGTLDAFASRKYGPLRLPTPLPSDVSHAAGVAMRRPSSAALGKRPKDRETDDDTIRATESLFGHITGASLEDINRDASYYPPSQPIESLAILDACLSANLLSRALRIFEDMREVAAARISHTQVESIPQGSQPSVQLRQQWSAQHNLSRAVYASVLSAILRRAAAEGDPLASQQWIGRAWLLYREMETGVKRDGYDAELGHSYTADPLPDEWTVMTFAMGLVKTMSVHSDITLAESGLGDLVASAWRMGLSIDEIVDNATAFSTEAEDSMRSSEHVDAQIFVQRLIAAAVYAGNDSARVALEMAERRLIAARDASQRYREDGEGQDVAEGGSSNRLPPLKPVISGKANSDGSSPLNLDLLRRDLGILDRGRSGARDSEERQRWLEESALDSARQHLEAVTKDLQELGLKSSMTLNKDRQLQLWMWDWNKKLTEALSKDIPRILEGAESSTKRFAGQKLYSFSAESKESFEMAIAPFLGLIPVAKLALVTIMEVMRLQATAGVVDGIKTASTLIGLGRAIEEEHYAEILRKRPDISERVRRAHEAVRNKSTTDVMARRRAKKWLESQDEGRIQWTQNVRARVGSYLLGHLLRVATIRREALDRDGHVWSEEHPAMVSTYQYVQGKKVGVLKLNETVGQRLDKESARAALHARYLPMLVKPRLWLKPDEGGYLTTKTNMMRYKESAEQVSYLKAASEDGNRLETVMCGLDALGETPWVINRKILEVMTQVWNSGKDTADMPPLIDEDWKRQERPADYDTNLVARNEYLTNEKATRMQRAAIHAQRCDVNYKLEIARAFADEVFYFPHNVDFRGRAYPVPPHLNHMGDDLCRGLLLFAEAKPLGAGGLKWLRIHLANVYGYDKASFDERVQFSVDHYADVEAAVKDPLGENKWWLGADDPWQCLATCHELYAAINHPEGPEKYASRMPVHQDGTCNGLQHYAALGGDIRGAKQVNLTSGERPADVYTAVADLVIQEIEEEARRPDPDPAAVELLGKVTRKVVKQTVMTTVYGVTFIGAKNQVSRQLVDRGDIDPQKIWIVSTYLAKKILACIGNLFAGANRIQHWLVDVARLISRSIPPERMEKVLEPTGRIVDPKTGLRIPNPTRVALEQMTSVIWTTPIGMPIVQPYRRHKKAQIATALQTLFLRDPNVNAEVSPTKQASAFPPNFIHSLDATHMLLSALECQDAGLTFAAVHDSYWTHACDVETMSDIIRDTFVRLHTQDILPRLREEFLERYKGHMVPVSVAQYLIARRMTRSAQEGVAAMKEAELTGVELTQAEKDELLRSLRGTAGTTPATTSTDDVADVMAPADEDADVGGGDAAAADFEDVDAAVDADVDSEAANADQISPTTTMDATILSELRSRPTEDPNAPKRSPGRPRLGEEPAAPKPSKPTGRGRGKGKGKRGDLSDLPEELREAAGLTKFVPIEALLPPLPAKGGFDVNEIRKSKYFFS